MPGAPPPFPFPPPPPYAPPPLESDGVTTVFIGNASPHATEMELFALFSPHGPVSGINFQRAKSCAFVVFRHRACAEAALARLAGAPLAGVPMRLSWGRHVAKGAGALPAAGAAGGGAPPLPPPPQQRQQQQPPAGAAAGGGGAPPAAPGPPALPLPQQAARLLLSQAADGVCFNAAAANAQWGFSPWSGADVGGTF